MSSHRAAPRPRDGGSLRRRLLALVLLPLVGVGVLSNARVQELDSAAARAGRLHDLVRTVGELDQARIKLSNELNLTTSWVASTYPTAVDNPVLNAFNQQTAMKLTKDQVVAAQGQTDAALRTVRSEPTTKAAVDRLIASLGPARTQMLTGTASNSTYADAFGAGQLLTDLEGEQIRLAQQADANVATQTALRDLDLVATALDRSGLDVPAFVGQVSAKPGTVTVPLRTNLARSWGDFLAASDAVNRNASAPVKAAWAKVRGGTATEAVEDVLTIAVLDPSKVTFDQVKTVFRYGGDRINEMSAVLVLAVQRAEQAASEERAAALRERLIIGLGVLLLVIASIVVALLARRALSRPLNRLAKQAQQVSQGELAEVEVGGPREIRTVARGLQAAVASLRKIEAQAAAVAAGDLESSVVREPLPGPLGSVVHASVDRIVTAIEERERAQQDLAHRAAHDALTELPNRAQALLLIERSLIRSARGGAATGLMFVDLDHFKAVNDTLGHEAGDDVLRQVATRMQGVVRDGDTVARLGGDEFVVLLEDVDDETDIMQLANRIVAVVSAPMTVADRPVKIGASVGVALCQDSYTDPSRLLREADAAAYQAKRAGRGRVGIYDEGLRTQLTRRAELESAMRQSLRDEDFVLYYQPVVNLRDRALLGFEALIRWQRPGVGLVSPDEFIPVAESSTLINEIERWTLGAATAHLADLIAADPGAADLTVAVNISGRHLLNNQLVTDVQAALAQSRLPARNLVIEVTETVLVDDAIATDNMHRLRALGVRIAIDDFGTGYTSIGQLPRLPIDSLKIDRSFVASSDPATQELVRLMVATAQAFNLGVIAEGVERPEQASAMSRADVTTAQGFLFSEPRPADELGAIVRSFRTVQARGA